MFGGLKMYVCNTGSRVRALQAFIPNPPFPPDHGVKTAFGIAVCIEEARSVGLRRSGSGDPL